MTLQSRTAAGVEPGGETALSEGQAALLSEKSGGADPFELQACARACGFDGRAYLFDNPALQRAGVEPSFALLHFLAYGYAEHREISCGVFPDGLDLLRSLAIPNRQYAARLAASLFFGQMRNPATADRLWTGIDETSLECVRAMGGIPYFVIGDSHAAHYVQRAWIGERWLAALPMTCHGAAAIELSDPKSRFRYGAQILRWARITADLINQLNIPVFLKFGGLDAEFRWILERIRNARYQFQIGEFDDFARKSISAYARFLDGLARIIDPKLLRVCAVFPAVLADGNWSAGFLTAHRSSPERDHVLAVELSRTEIPSLSTRTHLRGLYNDYLREMCRERALVFADDFSPLLDGQGNTAEGCYARHGGRDFHVDYRGSQDALVTVIQRFIDRSGSKQDDGALGGRGRI